MKIFFHSAYWGYRGTEVALYDYAHHAEKIFGAESIILVSRERAATGGPLGERFRQRFRVVEYESWNSAEKILRNEGVDLLYTIKNGFLTESSLPPPEPPSMPSFPNLIFTGIVTPLFPLG